MAGRDFLGDILCSDETEMPSSKAPTKDVFSNAKKPPSDFSAVKSSNAPLRKLVADQAGFKGIDEGGTGELTSDGPGLPFRIKCARLVPNGLGLQALGTVAMPYDVHVDKD
mmetsp:Transcript_49921/g.100488  ORF Transcript_49921/g.100488 Transcript_49921/m.100488 type:complete len:111 (-) Transcript_49921:197-529(-)